MQHNSRPDERRIWGLLARGGSTKPAEKSHSESSCSDRESRIYPAPNATTRFYDVGIPDQPAAEEAAAVDPQGRAKTAQQIGKLQKLFLVRLNVLAPT